MKSGWYSTKRIAERETRWIIGLLPSGDALSLLQKGDGTTVTDVIKQKDIERWEELPS